MWLTTRTQRVRGIISAYIKKYGSNSQLGMEEVYNTQDNIYICIQYVHNVYVAVAGSFSLSGTPWRDIGRGDAIEQALYYGYFLLTNDEGRGLEACFRKSQKIGSRQGGMQLPRGGCDLLGDHIRGGCDRLGVSRRSHPGGCDRLGVSRIFHPGGCEIGGGCDRLLHRFDDYAEVLPWMLSIEPPQVRKGYEKAAG